MIDLEKVVKMIVDRNYTLEENERVYVEYEGAALHDLFLDETARFDVDPLKYYGPEVVEQFIRNALK